MGCIVMDDCLYVVGGTNRHNEVLQSVERYHFKEDRWQEIPPMLDARASPSIAAVNGKIYVFGGKNDYFPKNCTFGMLFYGTVRKERFS